MNALLTVAKITNNHKIRKYCAVQRNKQLNRKWEKEKLSRQRELLSKYTPTLYQIKEN